MNIESVDKSVLIRIKWFMEKHKLDTTIIYDITDDKDGWFLASDKIKAVAGATTAEISLEFRWSTGTVWWDDISMEPSDAVPPTECQGWYILFPSARTYCRKEY